MHKNLPVFLAPQPPPELQSLPEPEEGPAMGLELSPAVLVLDPASPHSFPPDLEHSATSPSTPQPALELDPSGPAAGIQISTCTTAPSPEPDYPWAMTTKKLIREEKHDFLNFPAQLMTEQLTLMYVVSSEALRIQ